MVDGQPGEREGPNHLTEVLGLIPARGGSKSIPQKNIRDFAGHPLIAYSIASGLASRTINRVVVSTDDQTTIEITRKFGAEAPFIRPSEFSQDHTPDLPVFQHALQWLRENEGYQPEIIVQLRPTSPFRRIKHIDLAVTNLLERPDADSIRSICVPFQNPYKMWQIQADGFIHPILDTNFHEPYNLPRQSLPEVYWQTGYVDAARAGTILNKKSMTGECILPLIIDPSEWIDIDTLDDWRRAERLLESGEITFEDLGFYL